MTILQKAMLAIWNGIEVGKERQFELWHSHVHLLQKADSGQYTVGSRYISAQGPSGGYFTLYESNTPAVFGPAGYTAPSPTLDEDIATRKTFTDFIRGVFVERAVKGSGTGGWLATVAIASDSPDPDLSVCDRLVEDLAGHDGILQVKLCTYDSETTSSFTLRHKPLPTLPTAPWLILLHGIDRSALTRAVETLKNRLVESRVPATVEAAQVFTLQHEFQA